MSSLPADDNLVGEELQFNLYVGEPCNLSDVVDNPLFSGLPVVISD